MTTFQKFFTLILTVSLFAMYSCGPSHSIEAHIEGLGDNDVLVTYYEIFSDDRSLTTDTVSAADGKFVYDIDLPGTVQVSIEPANLVKINRYDKKESLESQTVILYLQPGEKVSVKGSIEPGYIDYRMKGTQLNKDLAEARALNRNSLMKFDEVNWGLDEFFRNFPETGEEREKAIEERNRRFEEMREYKGKISESNLEYAKANPDSDASAIFVMSQSPEDFREYYPTLSDRVRNGVFEPFFARTIKSTDEYFARKEAEKNIVEGNPAPLFTAKDQHGNDLSLNDVKAEYIVLDFWGSWCGWCIVGFPKMKEYYKKYDGRLEIIGIDCNDPEEKWIAAIGEHDLPWLHVIEDKDDKLSVKYGVSGYPTKLILDPEYKIVYVAAGEGPGFYDKLDELMAKK